MSTSKNALNLKSVHRLAFAYDLVVYDTLNYSHLEFNNLSRHSCPKCQYYKIKARTFESRE